MCYLTHEINTILQWNVITDSFTLVFLYVGEKERLQSNQGNSSSTPEDYTINKSHGNLNWQMCFDGCQKNQAHFDAAAVYLVIMRWQEQSVCQLHNWRAIWNRQVTLTQLQHSRTIRTQYSFSNSWKKQLDLNLQLRQHLWPTRDVFWASMHIQSILFCVCNEPSGAGQIILTTYSAGKMRNKPNQLLWQNAPACVTLISSP